MSANAMRPWFLVIFGLLCFLLQGCEEEHVNETTYSWVVEKFYNERACGIFISSDYFPLDTCQCGDGWCQMWSKSGANTVTRKDFAETDKSCKSPEKTETLVTGTCIIPRKNVATSYIYDFAGDGPAAVFEEFATITCDPGTSNGNRRVWRTGTCLGGCFPETCSWNMVCVGGKVKVYNYTSATCASGGKLLSEAAVGECSARYDTGLLYKGGC